MLKQYQSSNWDVPAVWTETAILSVGVYGFSEGSFNVARLDPATGVTMASTPVPFGAVSQDGGWAVAVDHVDLGDENDRPYGLFPQPFNTMLAGEIGGGTSTIRQQAHHQYGVLSAGSNASRILYMDSPSVDRLPGVESNPEYGLFLMHGGTASRLAAYDAKWAAASFLDDSDAFVAVRGSGSSLTLVRWDGTNFHDLDTADTGGVTYPYAIVAAASR